MPDKRSFALGRYISDSFGGQKREPPGAVLRRYDRRLTTPSACPHILRLSCLAECEFALRHLPLANWIIALSLCWWQCAKTSPCSGFWMQGIQIFVRCSRNFTGPAGFQSPNHSSFHSYWQDETLGITTLLNGAWSSVPQR
jgi:hypothetical protein